MTYLFIYDLKKIFDESIYKIFIHYNMHLIISKFKVTQLNYWRSIK